ncbi:riboflavin biosynthesis protein RibF [Chlamydiota bacterium]
MKIHDNLNLPHLKGLLALSIGNFDGIHLGHQAILKRLKELAPQIAVFTFTNHPAEVLRGASISRLTTLAHRLALLEKWGVDHVILATFTHAFAEQSAETFLRALKMQIPFSHLILGHDAAIGHDRRRDLQSLSKPLAFALEYLEPVTLNSQIVSSSAIRKHILAGELKQASALLGRPYSIFATVEPGQGKGREIGFHTANLPVNGLALPPLGVYAVEVHLGNERLPAVANLGHAPTLHTDRPAYLEVHLINDQRDLYGKQLDVVFLKYIRPEKQFANRAELQAQIAQDILSATATPLLGA